VGAKVKLKMIAIIQRT